MAWWLALAVGASGCSGLGCSEVGGYDGVRIQVTASLYVGSGEVALEVCDAAGCADATHRLRPAPEEPVGREVVVSFDDLGRPFEPGVVTTTVELTGPSGDVVATAREEVRLRSHHPNGEGCDGEGFVVGSLRLDADDRA